MDEERENDDDDKETRKNVVILYERDEPDHEEDRNGVENYLLEFLHEETIANETPVSWHGF